MAERKKFTRSGEVVWVEFDVDEDTFLATSVSPGGAILDVSAVNDAPDMEKMRIIMAFLDQVLHPDSAALFAERFRSATNPIELAEAITIAVWLVEEVYATERPTEGPSPSPNGSSTTTPSSTGTASSEGSTQEPQTRRVL